MSGGAEVEGVAVGSMPKVTIRVRRVPGAPVVGVRAWVSGGARVEEHPGQALVTGRSLSEGTVHRDWREIADASEALGAAIASSASFEAHGASVDVRSAHWREGLEWAVELLTEPSFPEERCRWMARQAASELDSLRDQPEARAGLAFLEQLYAPHPRSRPLQGSAESLERLGAAECRAFHDRALAAGGLTITVAGDFGREGGLDGGREVDEERVEAYLGELLTRVPVRSAWSAGAGSAPVPAPAEPLGLPESHRRVDLPPGDQAHLYAGCLTVHRAHPDRHALEVLGIVLGAGAGLTGRLPERVREREGLAYSVQVHALAGAGLDRGRLVVYVGTSPGTVAQAERAVTEELRRVVEEGVGADEVGEARSYLLGRDPFRRETARQWADLLSEALLYGVPEDDPAWSREELEAVGVDEVVAAARRHIDLARLKVTVGVPRAS